MAGDQNSGESLRSSGGIEVEHNKKSVHEWVND
jgi:hypothetical protein